MADKAKWPIADRAADLERAKDYQKEVAKQQDTRQQTQPKPCDSEGNCS